MPSAAPPSPEPIQHLVDQGLELIPLESSETQAFVRIFLENTPPEELAKAALETLVARGLSLWSLAVRRKPGECAVSVTTHEREDSSSYTLVELVNEDRPFLVDSVAGALHQRHHRVHLLVHPVATVSRETSGEPVISSEGTKESFISVTIEPLWESSEREDLKAALVQVMTDVKLSVTDWRPMRAKVLELVSSLDSEPPPVPQERLAECQSFLRWMENDHFTFLGYRYYHLKEVEGELLFQLDPTSGLGVLRHITEHSKQRRNLPLPVRLQQKLRHSPELLTVSKSSRISQVHRPVHMDMISIRHFDSQGVLKGEHRILGLFTSVAYNQSVKRIPLLRSKVTRTFERSGFDPQSHDGKSLSNILETFPRDELFQIDSENLYKTAMGILGLQFRERVALFTRRDDLDRFISCLVFVPRDRWSSDLRATLGGRLAKAWEGEITAFYTHLSESSFVRTLFIVKTSPESVPSPDLAFLEDDLAHLTRSWGERLSKELDNRPKLSEKRALLKTMAPGFSVAYRESHSSSVALEDMLIMETALESGRLQLQVEETDERHLSLRLFHPDRAIELSSVLPLLENLGVDVLETEPYEVQGESRVVWIHEFILRRHLEGPALDSLKDSFLDLILQVFYHRMENDALNRLTLSAGLTARDITILQAYTRYLMQSGSSFSLGYTAVILERNPDVARALVKYFVTLFDPDLQGSRQLEVEQARTLLQEHLDSVTRLEDDRVLRRYVRTVEATLRTNLFQQTPQGDSHDYLSLKFDGLQVPDLPEPRPRYEVFVYSPRVEAVHLRGGPVARGGIRWSDRREDFRTEILGLMKAQMVKNSVIVPVGAKGGFIVKQPPTEGGREALLAEGIECYKTLMRGLLDITDNLVEGEVVPPESVVRRDDDDPYLVVAADKGTASFSDIANGISEDYGFWLGDAFASGGSQGYDHKKMGITARGAWEAVKRHFRELGHDTQRQNFTVVGVGDMGGDVFGNGMLQSDHIELVGAFNHLHIFLDPNPNPKTSVQERRRLFELPRSSWADYDEALISRGGGVFDRSAKSIPLTEETKALLGTQEESLSPDAVIRALLTASVDLLWFGGIGTFIKSKDESNRDAGDRANDSLRVNATDLKARVIGEGANLGCTQKGRVEAALAGILLNTDAIDNVGGVACSDREVNIKILFSHLMQQGVIDRDARNALLVEMTDDVARLVLLQVYQQTQALSSMTADPVDLKEQAELIRHFERLGVLDRAIEDLPNDEEIEDRARRRLGFTRPELAIILAYAKNILYSLLLKTDLPTVDYLEETLRTYFPRALGEKYHETLSNHRLHREIVATEVSGEILNRLGPTAFFRLMEDNGLDAGRVARAYLAARETMGAGEIWTTVENLDGMIPASLQTRILRESADILEKLTEWIVHHWHQGRLSIPVAIGRLQPGFAEISRLLEEALPANGRRDLRRRRAEYERLGVPGELARRLSGFRYLIGAPDVIRLAEDHSFSVEVVSRLYFRVGQRFGFARLRKAASRLRIQTRWDKEGAELLARRLFQLQRVVTGRVLESLEGSWKGAVDRWVTANLSSVAPVDRLLSEFKKERFLDLAQLVVARYHLERLGEREDS